jgi:hypothetical protein
MNESWNEVGSSRVQNNGELKMTENQTSKT